MRVLKRIDSILPDREPCYEVTSENITFRPDGHVADMSGFITQEDMYSTTPDKGQACLRWSGKMGVQRSALFPTVTEKTSFL